MITFNVGITPNIGKLANAFMSVDINGFLKREVNQMAMAVVRYAKQLTPVDTGFLRGSIQVSPELFGIRAVVSTNTDYAIFVHEGTKYMRKRPFMLMGAAFAQVSQLEETNKRLDAEFVKEFKTL